MLAVIYLIFKKILFILIITFCNYYSLNTTLKLVNYITLNIFLLPISYSIYFKEYYKFICKVTISELNKYKKNKKLYINYFLYIFPLLTTNINFYYLKYFL